MNAVAEPAAPLVVTVRHEPFIGEPFNAIFQLIYNGQSEELDHRESLEWFRVHGAKDMEKVNSALNQAANFGGAEIVIGSPVFPQHLNKPGAPRI